MSTRIAGIVKPLVLRLVALAERYPGTLALFGFLSGVASFILVDRQAELAKVIAALMLASWIWLTLENLLRDGIARRFGFDLPPVVLKFATQLVHQESLFFVLPFFFLSTTWASGQIVFTGLLAIGALVSIVDPLYYKWLSNRRWLYLGFHSLTLFAVLLTALPIIIHLTTSQSYALAIGITLVLSFPSLSQTVPLRRWWRAPLLALMLTSLGVTLWAAQLWVPPATLRLTEVAITTEMDGPQRTPGDRIRHIDANALQHDGLFAYTAVNAPRGLNERIYHVWRHEGQQVDRIALDIRGGREAGYRAWTRKRHFPADPVGRWQVQVVTEGGQLLGILRFQVTR
ncbi:DUF2914 domain-containing protein [Alcanivorax sp. JB21]|uniref:DUF5924 family protein n=1 Tax=Alcanivorax limicola TaxID=2874102 RepID=UPI001CC0A873|nr:DUF5924 family protein [Alcanivorax limicola]MBZ2189050.1 DUF2914 domain-containing protein [Alcanivorax limicola]